MKRVLSSALVACLLLVGVARADMVNGGGQAPATAGGTCGTLGGDLSGTCAAATVAKINGVSVSQITALSGNGAKVVTGTGTYTSTHGLVIDANGNVVDSGSVPAAGTVTGSGTTTDLAVWSSSTGLTNYAGSACGAGTVATSIDAAGAVTCVTAGSTNITNVSGGVFVIANKSSTGTTVNKLVKLDTSASPATAVISGTSDVNAVLGVCVADCGTTGSATVLTQGTAKCQFDNTATVGHYVIVSTGTAGDCSDSGSGTTYPTGVMVLGQVAESGNTSATRTVAFNTPDVASASAGPNGKGSTVQVAGTNTKVTANFNATTPAAGANNVNVTFQSSDSGNTTSVSAEVATSGTGAKAVSTSSATPSDDNVLVGDGTTWAQKAVADCTDTTGNHLNYTASTNAFSCGTSVPASPTFTNLIYTGTLSVRDIQAESSNFTIAHRIEYVTTSTSTIVATTPTSPTVGDTYTVVKADSGNGNITWTRAGSQTLNGATTRVVSAQYGVDTCVYAASNVWICQGNAT